MPVSFHFIFRRLSCVYYLCLKCTWWTSWLWNCSESGPGACLERLWLVRGREHDVTEKLLVAWHRAEVNWLQRDWDLESFFAVWCFWLFLSRYSIKNESSFALLCISFTHFLFTNWSSVSVSSSHFYSSTGLLQSIVMYIVWKLWCQKFQNEAFESFSRWSVKM